MRGMGIVLMLLVGTLAVVVSVGVASDVQDVRLRDKCNPVTFNDAVGPGTCLDVGANVTFAEFVEELNPKDGGHGAWRFNPDDTHIDEGETIEARNESGEVHSFTEVVEFGAGIVPILNSALPPGTPPVIPVNPMGVGGTFVAPGASSEVNDLDVGNHKFMCLIHPWMRTVVEVRED